MNDMAVPADGPIRGEKLGKLLGAELAPLDRFVIRSHQGWGMVKMIIETKKWSKALATIHAALPFIPLGNNVPQQAVLRIGFDLFQTLLSAVLTFRPA